MAGKTLFEGGASSVLFLDRRQFYLDPNRVAELWPSVMPFVTLLTKLGKKKVDDPLFKMFEHSSAFVKQEFAISTGSETIDASTGNESNALTVSSITGLNSTVNSSYHGLVCEVWDSTETTKKGVVIVTDTPTDGVATTGTVKVKNAKYSSGTTNDITTASGDIFKVIGNVRGEGSVAPEAWADELSTIWNSTQFMSVPVEITGRLYQASKLRGYDPEIARLRDEKGKEFKMQKENAFLKGVSVLGTNMGSADTFSEANLRTISDSNSNSGAVRMTYGFIPVLEDYGTTYTYGSSTTKSADTNIFKLHADYQYADYVDDTEILFDKTEDDQKYAFSGRGAMSYWSKLSTDNTFSGRSGWKVDLGGWTKNKLGFNIRTLETPHGMLHMASTKALRDVYNNYMCIPDHNHIFMAEYEADQFKNNIKTDDDYDGVKDVYKADQGFGMEQLKKHHIMVTP